jgi:hypothetical protein
MRFRWLAFATMFMSIPLFASYPIKHTMFPLGYVFVAAFTWGLVAVPTLPVLLNCELLLILIALRRHTPLARFRIHQLAVIIAILSEAVFLYVRSYA